MGFRVVDKSYFTFETDLPPASRNIHPSGVLHAFRSTPASSEPGAISNGREEQIFAWINNSLHIEKAIKHLENFGFDRSNGIVLIPYSTKRNWMDRYPHAAPALETSEEGKVVVYLNWRPYPNGLSELGSSGAGEAIEQPTLNEAVAAPAVAETKKYAKKGPVDSTDVDYDADGVPVKRKRKKKYPQKRDTRKRRERILNIVQDNSLLPNAERDELHIEIYNYLSWLHEKLSAIQAKNEAAEALAKIEAPVSDDEVTNDDKEDNTATPSRYVKRKKTDIVGVDVAELEKMVDKFQSTFSIILNYTPEKDEHDVQSKGAPFIEEALTDALTQLVAARDKAGKPKRSRKWKSKTIMTGQYIREFRGFADFDEMFQRLMKYKEEHGDCLVTKRYPPDEQLGLWVCQIRSKKSSNLKKGIEFEEVPSHRVRGKTLTAERIERLNSIGFEWRVDFRPKQSWDEMFQELIEYYEMNGKWPSQSLGKLGDWAHKQRQRYTCKEPSFMQKHAHKMDEIGFEWTPRGNTRMKWDEGLEMLLAFGKLNGHFDVPTNSELDKKSDAHLLHKWVESLHDMHRSYQLGRQPGSLTDERIELLRSHGFVFRI